ncbi:lytic murein transglycosylase B [Marinomonas agarivorans]|nr:lytic murein transglycosylase B [Marinomonas agarivorans]
MKYALLLMTTLSLTACANNSSHVDRPLLVNDKDKLSSELQKERPHYKYSYANEPKVQKFIRMMVEKHNYDESLLQAAFASIKTRKKSIKKSNNQPEVIAPYYQYRKHFLEIDRIKAGRDFSQKYKSWLNKAEKEFGVPADIIVALIGVETFYGRVMGNIDVFTSLSTLAFDYPRRTRYFQSELEAYLLLVRDNEWPIGKAKGSYSGALGMGQFMPSNYRKLAIDYDNNGVVDLWSSVPDAIGSVGRYLQHHGWQQGKTPVISVKVDNTQKSKWKSHINEGRSPIKYLPEWHSIGVAENVKEKQEKTGLIALRTANKVTSYWLANKNFFVIMRYNPSRRYSMAVLELAKEISSE